MKKTKRAAILIATAVLACGAVAFSACNNNENENSPGVAVSESEWNDKFALKSYDSFTIKEDTYIFNAENNKYELEGTLVEKVDRKNKISFTQTYGVDGSTSQKFDIFEYTFAYQDKYYCCNIVPDFTYMNYVSELTKEEFDDIFNFNITNATLSQFITSYEQFEYDSKTDTYQFTQEVNFTETSYTNINKIQFIKDGGFKLEIEMLQYGKSKIFTEKLNSTTISIPKQAYTDVDAYLADKNANDNN